MCVFSPSETSLVHDEGKDADQTVRTEGRRMARLSVFWMSQCMTPLFACCTETPDVFAIHCIRPELSSRRQWVSHPPVLRPARLCLVALSSSLHACVLYTAPEAGARRGERGGVAHAAAAHGAHVTSRRQPHGRHGHFRLGLPAARVSQHVPRPGLRSEPGAPTAPT